MKLLLVFAAVLVWTSPLLAETYAWEDENGTYNFTEDYSRVPQKYRSKLIKREDMGAAAEVKGSAAAPPVAKSDSQGTTSAKSEESPGSFGGKSYEQWKQELASREAELNSIRTRAKEIESLSKNTANAEQAKALVVERNAMAVKFAELRKQYDQLVEQARKAGLRVDMAP